MEDGTFIGDRLILFISFFAPLQLILVILRFSARRLTARSRGLDDWLVVASLLSQFVQSGISIGQHEAPSSTVQGQITDSIQKEL